MKRNMIFLFLGLLLTACASGSMNTSSPPATVEAAPIATSTPTVSAYTPIYEPAECPFSLPQGVSEGKDVNCGILTVPEDRTKPEGRQVKLTVAYFNSPSSEAGQAPLIYLEGGPGVSALEPLQYSFGKYASLLQTRDLIFFDQRGVGLSQPALDCPEHLAFINQSLEQVLTPDETLEQLTKVFLECHDRLLDEGIDLSMYNTRQSAADVADLRTALGIESWDMFSISYGTRLALEVMRWYPEGIRSVILDSVVSPQADQIAEASTNVEAALQTLFTACQQDPACQQSFPELETLLFELVDALNANPAQIPVANLLTGEQYNAYLDGNTFLGVIIQSLYSAEVLPVIPMMVYETAEGNFSKLSSLRSSYLTNTAFMSSGMYYSVLCHEKAPFSSPTTVAATLELHPRVAGFFEHSMANSQNTFDFCEQWNAGRADESQSQLVESSIHSLVLAGQFDPATPPGWSQQVADRLENSYYFEFQGVGHSPSLSHPCPNSIMLSFLAAPSQMPESSCMAEMKLSFMLPQDLASLSFVPAEVPDAGIAAIAPQGWYAVKPEYYVSPDQKVELVFSKNTSDPLPAYLAIWGAEDPLDTVAINGLNWEIYAFSQPDRKVAGFTAVSQGSDGFYFVLIVGAEELQEALFQNVFAPVLQSFTVLN